ncbi:L,D-transpeptidase family protein [Pontibacterium granulatum]|uniref:L,D-transpeptidase family protein n=1 Tax=Pontibacterium granulatum TaxID=2036029 RepID=UPI00249A20DE|nr:L,D-transpeptidase family protein [Pontibacterium granulatum]MDI3324733.1 L,D-transpeptidase family protein [Pontibacterium granulatum]
MRLTILDTLKQRIDAMLETRTFTIGLARLALLMSVVGSAFWPGRVAVAASWILQEGQDVVGGVEWHRVSEADTLVSIARRFGVGYDEIIRANPMLDIWLPEAQRDLQLPLQFILPSGSRQGLVLNLAEMRLYYYPREEPVRVYSYPVGIGREGWQTPVTTTRIVSKVTDPNWYPPQSIREEALATGTALPDLVPAGPENPLGSHALRLGLSGYLLHGTNRPAGVGMRVSHGCIRLYPEDIVALFAQVEVGTKLRIIDEPFKLGWLNDQLYLEVHPAAYTSSDAGKSSLAQLLAALRNMESVGLNSFAIQEALDEASGVPVHIGTRLARQP